MAWLPTLMGLVAQGAIIAIALLLSGLWRPGGRRRPRR